ncbi:LysM peptidoglycan-binding domain-containing protein [Sphingobacterium sp. HJSM2_6]|uniref:LysM peptidoglycan-binding domain-containing protein n=1 Tax=Sphingobacterium sp. HJSM2_6 TaxID=3366264 RepID=UPI003BE75D41
MNKNISFLVTIGFSVLTKFGLAQQHQLAPAQVSENLQSTVIEQMHKERQRVFSELDADNQSEVSFSQDDVLISQRIQRLQKTVPLVYNAKVKAYLDKYISKNYKPYIEKLLGLGNYYFPIYDQIFEENGIPNEVKYLSVVESSLSPHTVSTSGAVGLWQFVYGTAKSYHFQMDANFDERKDVYASTYAVSDYLKEAYGEFDDWLLALASYNCGRGCVRRAIIRSGLHNPTYWELSPFLPKETQNYIPKFIAMTYVMNHAQNYNLSATDPQLGDDHKIMMVQHSISLEQLAKSLGFAPDMIKELNPAYKKAYISASAEKPKRLIIPYQEQFSDSLIYATIHHPGAVKVAEAASLTAKEKTHLVKRGESLASIAKKYEVSVQNLKAWNDLSSKSSIVGKTLVIQDELDKELTTHVLSANLKKESKKKSNPTYLTYTVRKGDTLSDIAQKYKGSTVSRLKSDNNLKGSALRIGQKIKVYKGNG